MMKSNNYWTSLGNHRLSRRRLLVTTAGGVSAAALLAACRGDNDSGAPKTTDRSGLLATPQDTSSKAITGGILNLAVGSDTAGFDGLNAVAITPAIHNDYAYARLVNAHKVFNFTRGEKFDTSVDPYAAESWEKSPDGLQITFKLRGNGGLDPRPPTNGRVLDSQDVVFSWNRYKASGRSRTLMVNELGADGAVVSIQAVDARTVVMKLAYPSVSIMPLLGFFFYWQLQPREADGGFDPRSTMRGSGPWMLEDYRPSAQFSYRRNPNFFRKDRPFLDGIDLPIITEYAQGLAQLKAGRLHNYNVRAEDVIQAKQDVQSLNLYPVANFTNSQTYTFFSFKAGSPWQDDRLRQALSMLVDRPLYINTMFNVEKFTSQGLEVPTRWNTVFTAAEEPFWLDPQGSEFGPNSKYFKYDPAEAKKLVQATGRNAVEANWNTIAGFEYGPDYRREAEILKGMWEAGGDFKFNTVTHDYTTVFIPRFASFPQGGRNFDGAAFAASTGFPEVDVYLRDHFMPGGTLNRFEPGYTDPQWEGMVKAQKSELDPKRRLSLLKDIQRHHAGKMYTIPRAGAALTYQLWSPSVMNVRAFGSRLGIQNPSAEWLHYWLNR